MSISLRNYVGLKEEIILKIDDMLKLYDSMYPKAKSNIKKEIYKSLYSSLTNGYLKNTISSHDYVVALDYINYFKTEVWYMYCYEN